MTKVSALEASFAEIKIAQMHPEMNIETLKDAINIHNTDNSRFGKGANVTSWCRSCPRKNTSFQNEMRIKILY